MTIQIVLLLALARAVMIFARALMTATMFFSLPMTALATTALRVDWGASTDPAGSGVFSYNVYRCTGAACTPTVKIGSTTTNTYFDTNTSALTTYCYAVTALDENGNESAKNATQCKQSLAYTTRTAANNALATVQAQVDAANDGDLIIVPTGSVTWAGPIILPTNKGVTIQCATLNACTINSGTSTAFQMNFWSSQIDFFYRISGFNFTFTGGGFAVIWFCGSGGCTGNLTNLRIDHNAFTLGTTGVAIFCGDNTSTLSCYGVADHNTLNATGNGAFQNQIAGNTPNPPQPPPLGTANNFFMEDNTVTFSTMTNAGEGCIDGWGGNDTVWRFNTTTDCLLTSHGVTHSGGPQNFEIYGNTFKVDAGATAAGFDDCTRCWHHQGSGTILAFNNQFTQRVGAAHSTDPQGIADYRAYVTGPSIDGSFSTCDGTANAPLTTNAATAAGNNTLHFASVPTWAMAGDFSIHDVTNPGAIPAQTGATSATATTIVMTANAVGSGVGSGDTIQINFQDEGVDGNTSPTLTYRGYPCWHQAARDFSAKLSPIYCWNNAWSDNGARAPCTVETGLTTGTDYTTNHFAADRDIFDSVSASSQSSPTSPFNGTTGMGFGTLANRPTTCSSGGTLAADAGNGGVGYFATDKGPNGTLYRCASTNTWVIHYQPYCQTDGIVANCRHPMTEVP